MRVKKSLLKFISKDLDRKKRLSSARREGGDFKALRPSDQVTALFVLSYERDNEISASAYETLAGAEVEFILSALEERLDCLVLRELFVHFKDNGTVLSAILRNKGIDNRLACTIAEEGPLEAIKTFAETPDLIERFPLIIDAVRKNPNAEQGLCERLEAAAKESQASHSIEAEARSDEKNLAATIVSGDDFESDRFNIYQAICNMTAGEKIKLAHTGDRSIRNLLIKDKNRIVALSVLKNPKLTEQEVTMTASSTNTSEEILRDIANSREWMKSYNIKMAMVCNPRTPLSSSLKLIDYLRERDLKAMAKNKGVPGVLKAAAERKLKLKSRH